jgi:hypothetical protein
MGSVWNSLLVGDVTTTVWAWMEFKTSDEMTSNQYIQVNNIVGQSVVMSCACQFRYFFCVIHD